MELRPIRLLHPLSGDQADLFAWFLARYHYLSFRQPVGENLRYLAVDRKERPLGCLLFGSACLCVPHADRRRGSAPRATGTSAGMPVGGGNAFTWKIQGADLLDVFSALALRFPLEKLKKTVFAHIAPPPEEAGRSPP